MSHKSILGAIGVAMFLPFYQAVAQVGGPTDFLPGRWSGDGTILMASGTTQKVSCRGTYKVEGNTIIKKLRCSDASEKVETSILLNVNNNQVTGSFEIVTFALNGNITGIMTQNAFNLNVNGTNFAAGLVIALTSQCTQRYTVSPTGLPVKRISIVLNRNRCKAN